jgi:hypothetical protein
MKHALVVTLALTGVVLLGSHQAMAQDERADLGGQALLADFTEATRSHA